MAPIDSPHGYSSFNPEPMRTSVDQTPPLITSLMQDHPHTRPMWSAHGRVAIIASLCYFAPGVQQVSAQGYTDVGTEQGLTFTVPAGALYFDIGTGVSFHDIDGDGQDDLSFGNRNGELKFFRNVNGTLEPMPSIGPTTGSTKAVLWADVDNDGDSDLLTTTFLGNVRLYHNNGDETFTDVTATAGFVANTSKYWGASFGDYDRDGFLDLYVCTYIYESEPFGYQKVNHLYHNDGDGTFTDVTIESGTGNGLKASFQSVWMDVDMDGWPDLYVINDFVAGNTLYRNNHDGTFTDVTVARGLLEGPEHCMSISPCDFDLDGDQDIFMSNTGIYPEVNNARQMLMLNDGTGTFTESSHEYGIDVFEWGWGALWVDHDNDGYQDLYLGTHPHVVPVIPPAADLFFKNQGGTSFVAAPELFSSSMERHTHAVARGDLNSDGYADIIVHGQDPFPPQIWLNNGGDAHYVRIGVEGTVSNRQGIGTWINVHAGGKKYMHYTVCGENYLGQNSPYVNFGLGESAVIDSVVVQYLSGHVDRYYNLPTNTLYRFTEGETFHPTIQAVGELVVCAPTTVVLDAGEGSSYAWSNGATERSITITASESLHVTVTSASGIVAESDTVDVIIGAVPEIVADEQDPTCAEEATGSITLENLSGISAQSVTWEEGGTGAQLSDLAAGTYTYTYVDVNGCQATGIVELIDPDPLFVLAIPVAASSGDNGSLSWTVFGGAPPFVSTFDGETVEGTSRSDLAPGEYALEVTDASGCATSTTVEVGSSVSVGERSNETVQVYPNPVAEVLYIAGGGPWKSWAITDASGRIVGNGSSISNGQLEVSRLATATYTIELIALDGRAYRQRFVKQP